MNAQEAVRRWIRHPLPWILLLAAVLRWQSAGYFRSSDDYSYANAALRLLQGTYRPGGFHDLRLGLIAPTALSFAIFGVHHLSSVLWPLLSSLLSIVVLHRMVERMSTKAAADWAALLLAVSTQHALSGAELFPDAPLTFLVLTALDLYLRERTGAGRPWGYAAVGVLFYLAAATRIEAVKLLPAFVAVEAFLWRRRGADRRMLWILPSLLLLAGLDTALMASRAGRWNARFDELFPAVEGWATSRSAENMGLAAMLKSLVSPFGAFGIQVPFMAWGCVGLVRQRRLGIPLFIAGYLLVTALAVAAVYRIADGRHYTILAPFVAWFAAEGIVRLPPLRLRALGATVAFLSVLFLHTRLMPDIDAAYRKLAETARTAPGDVLTDERTSGALRLYYLSGREVHAQGPHLPASPFWLANNTLMREIDGALHRQDSYIGDRGTLVETIPIEVRGLPGFRQAAPVLFAWRGIRSRVGEIRVYRATP